MIWPVPWASEGGSSPPLDFEIVAKEGCFLSFEWEKQISPFLAPIEKFWKNLLVASPGKNPSDAHVVCFQLGKSSSNFFIRSLQLSAAFLKTSLCSLYVALLCVDDRMQWLLVPFFNVCSSSALAVCTTCNTYPVMRCAIKQFLPLFSFKLIPAM